MHWRMPGSRNPEQLMFSVLFPPELNVVGNFHTAKEPVMVQFCCNGALTTAQICWSSGSFLLRASTACEDTHFPRSSPVVLSAQQMSDAALAVLLLQHFRIIFRRWLRKGTGKMLDRNGRCRGGEKPGYGDLKGVWEKQQWPADSIA